MKKNFHFTKLYFRIQYAQSHALQAWDWTSSALMRMWMSQQTSSNRESSLNTLGWRQNGCRFPDDIFKCIFLNENVWILFKISPRFVSSSPNSPINNMLALVQIMAWRRPGDKPLSEPMMVILLTHICVTWPQWVKGLFLWFMLHVWCL